MESSRDNLDGVGNSASLDNLDGVGNSASRDNLDGVGNAVNRDNLDGVGNSASRENLNGVGNSASLDTLAETVAQESTDFDVNLSIDDPCQPVEPTITCSQDDQVPNNLPEERPVSYEIVETGTQRGKARLHDSNGYIYTVKKFRNEKTNWWCSVRQKQNRCPASVIQKGSNFQPGKFEHNHPGNPSALVKTKVEVRAANRRRAAERPQEPTTLDFELQLELCGVDPDFMKADIKSEASRSILFATEDQLKLLETARTWYIDGTFKVVRKPFFQLLSIHSFLRTENSIKQVPLAFVLMSRRQEEDYVKVFESIKQLLPTSINMEEVVCDFEAAIWGAVRNVFPDVRLFGCYFHWSQAVFRHITSCGLKTAYMESGPLYKTLRRLLTLPYLPRKHIPDAFQEIREQAGTDEKVIELFKYVDKTWFGSRVWGVGNWSCYRRLIRTNNDCEGWHRRLNTRASKEKPPIYTLLPLLNKEAALVNLQYRLVAENTLSQSTRKSTKSHQSKLHNLWNKYEERDLTTSQFIDECISYVPF